MKSLVNRVLCAGLLYAPVLFGAEGEAPRRFAAPAAATAPATGSAGGIGQVMVALLVVLAAVFVVAMVMKRLRGLPARGAHGIEILSQASLGARERVVIVRVGDQRLLLGVATGQVSLLQTLPADAAPLQPEPDTTASAMPRFTELLRRSLGK